MEEDKKITKPEEPVVDNPAISDNSDVVADATTKNKPKPSKKKKSKRSVPQGQLHILATFNNTIVTFTDNSGGVLSTSSAGACGFRGSKKGTAYAAQIAAEKAGQIAKQNFANHYLFFLSLVFQARCLKYSFGYVA